MNTRPDFIPGTRPPIEIIEHIGILSQAKHKHTLKELNLIEVPSEFDNTFMDPKFDIREWSEDHTTCSFGVLLNEEEAQELVDLLYDYDIVPTVLKPFLIDSEYPDDTPTQTFAIPEYSAPEDDLDPNKPIKGQISMFDDADSCF